MIRTQRIISGGQNMNYSFFFFLGLMEPYFLFWGTNFNHIFKDIGQSSCIRLSPVHQIGNDES
jgi:hypothetical protein